MWNIGERHLPEGVVIDGGSDWIALHQNFAKYVTFESNQLLDGLRIFYKHTILPVEVSR